jgi:predicted alpha/beta hydrolase family esterase
MNCFQQHSCQTISRENIPIISFTPPSSVTYSYDECKVYELSQKCKKAKFLHDVFLQTQYNQYYWIKESFYLWEKPNKKTLCILLLQNKVPIKNRPILIFFQSSTSNLGTIYPHLYDIVTQLKCDLITFDYSGIGKSTGVFTESEIMSDAEAISQFISFIGIPKRKIIIMGFSIGCVPSLHYASTFKELYGLILVSPANFSDIKRQNKQDIQYKITFDNLRKVNCPILLIHGKKDELGLFDRTFALSKNLTINFSWFPKSCGHLNILQEKRRKLFTILNNFLISLAELDGKVQRNKLSSIYSKNSDNYKSTVEDEKTLYNLDETNKSYMSFNESRQIEFNKKMMEEFQEQF